MGGRKVADVGGGEAKDEFVDEQDELDEARRGRFTILDDGAEDGSIGNGFGKMT